MQDSSPDRALLLPKLRRYFAEFLHHSYLDRLSILYLTTCVGLGYGPCTNSLEAFLGSIGSLNSPQPATHHLSGTYCADLPTQRPTGLHPVIHHRAQLPSCVTPSLDYYGLGLVHPPPATRRWSIGFRTISKTGSPLGADTRVREYQPVVHRLRLSASP